MLALAAVGSLEMKVRFRVGLGLDEGFKVRGTACRLSCSRNVSTTAQTVFNYLLY